MAERDPLLDNKEMVGHLTEVQKGLDEHDARHAYLDSDDPEVTRCPWCRS